MSSWLVTAYPWIKSVHIIAVIAWMAGLLYLPRLYVYHAMASPGSAQSETFKLMERRLQRAIMRPAMIAALLFGAVLAATPGVVDWGRGWIWAKLAFAADRNRHPTGFFRAVNEFPTLAMIAIVVLVVVKPF
jgi:putative membrane protein